MANKLQLYRGTTLDLDMMTGNLRVRVDGWSPNSTLGEGEMAWDTFSLVGRATADATLGTAVYNLQEFISDARRYKFNLSRDNQLWLHYKPDSGQEVRTLILDGNYTIHSDAGANGLGPMMNNDGFVYMTASLEHMPYWEKITSSSDAKASLSLCGGEWEPDLTCGDLDGRISQLNITSFGGASYLDDVWVGIRPTYGGTSYFTALWECEKGTLTAGGGGTLVGTADASNGTAVRIDFSGTAAMFQRMRLGCNHIVGTAGDDFAGKYLVLGRLKCDASTECLIDLYQGLSQVGYSGTPSGIELVGETEVSNTSYKFIELGQVQIPPFGLQTLEGSRLGESDTELYIYAQRLSGSGYLFLDALVMMPCEHLLTIKGAGLSDSSDYIYFKQAANGKSIAMSMILNTTAELIEHSVVNFTYPKDGGIVVFAGQATTASSLAGTASITISQYPRYTLMRLT